MIGYGDTLHHLTATATAAPQAELDRFCNALISIREEIGEIESGSADKCAPGSADRLRLSGPGERALGVAASQRCRQAVLQPLQPEPEEGWKVQ